MVSAVRPSVVGSVIVIVANVGEYPVPPLTIVYPVTFPFATVNVMLAADPPPPFALTVAVALR